jgi:hypothetical protein
LLIQKNQAIAYTREKGKEEEEEGELPPFGKRVSIIDDDQILL